MNGTRTTGTVDATYRVTVENFGPIVNASVTLRPLTVFIGPSNTGKSYLAILLYALHHFLGGPQRYFGGGWRPLGPGRLFRGQREGPATSVLESLRAWAVERGSPVPADVLGYIDGELAGAQGPNRLLRGELRRCYGVDRLDELVRRQGARSGAELTVEMVGADGASGGRYRLGIGQHGKELSGTVGGMESLSLDSMDADGLLRDAREYVAALRSGTGVEDAELAAVFPWVLDRFFLELFRPLHRDAFYLPADRTGVMHSHQVVVSTLVQSATTAGLRPSRDIPMLSGVLADFLSELIEMRGPRRRRGRRDVDLGARLEEAILDGVVRLERSAAGYPTFAYRPRGWKDDLPLMRASSMVSELAPVVLYLRHVVQRGNLLIIEEPEAHLHPAMQTAFARELARLVLDGVRIVLTTHSEWFLEQIGNLVRLSEVPAGKRKGLDGVECALRPDQVGAWLFRRSSRPVGSLVEEVTLDAETGLYPTDYHVVSEMLYNQSARILNRAQAEAEG